MAVTRVLFLTAIIFLPFDGTDLLRLPLAHLELSIIDLLLALVFLLDCVLEPRSLGTTPPALRVPLLLALLAALLSAISLFTIPTHELGRDLKLTLNLLQLALTIYLAGRLLFSRRMLQAAVLALLLGTSVVAVATVAKGFYPELPGSQRKAAIAVGPMTIGVSGLTTIPGPLPMVVLLALPIAALSVAVHRRSLRVALVGLLLAAGFLSFYRSLWLAMAAQAVVLLAAVAFSEAKPGRRRCAQITLVSLAIACLVSGPRVFQWLVDLRPATVVGRLSGYFQALEFAASSWTSLFLGGGKSAYLAWAGTPTVPHNAYLDLLVGKGLLTLCLVLALEAWVLVFLWRVVQIKSNDVQLSQTALALFVGICGAVIFGLFSPTMTSLVHWMALALGCACIALGQGSQEVP